jgi:two-component system, OmpR family, phosphate regulon sensor histidine kinase PhoR
MELSESDFVRILEATRAITSTLSVSELLEMVMRLASEVVHVEACSLLLMDPATEELYFDVALGESGGALERIRLKKGEGIAGWVASHGEAAVVNDVAQDARWTQKGDQASKFKTKAILAVPMEARGRRVGVIEAINRVDGEPFSERDLKIFEFFAAQVAVAIENARLFESIRQEKEKMATILTRMDEGVLLLEPDGRIVLANRPAEQLIGRPLQGFPWPEIESSFEWKPGWQKIRALTHGVGEIELSRRASPTLILAGVVTPVLDDREQVTNYLIVLSDVTEARREALLKRTFLALVSHKLKTPLVAIRGFAPMLLENAGELSAFQKMAIETIDRNSILLNALVEKITWFAALEADTLTLTTKPQSLESVLDTALSEMSSSLQQSQAEVTQDDSIHRVPVFAMDKIWIKEAFRNLIENAIKFNRKGPRQLMLSAETKDGVVSIYFKDNGPGIPPEEIPKLFQKFYQIESSFTGQVEGMGLGLALVKRVVEAHGGSVSVQSTLGQGSVFLIRLPVQTRVPGPGDPEKP